jgi:phosphate-selective porin
MAWILYFEAAVCFAEDNNGLPVTANKPIQLSGNIIFRASAVNPGSSGFSINKARLAFSGELIKDISFKFQVETVPTPYLLDAQLDIVFNEAAALRLGQFKVPFSQENIYTDTDLCTIKRSQPVVAMCPGFDTDSLGRDIGITFHGRLSTLEYTAGVFNGEGINKAATNKPKDLAGRILFTPTDSLSLGASYYDGTQTPISGAPTTRKERAGVELTLNRQAFTLNGEFIIARDGALDRQGWYLQAAHFLLPKKLQGVFKVDSYNQNKNVPGNRSNLWTIGINWFIAARIKIQANHELYKNEAGRTTKKAFMVQIRAGF